MEQTLKAEPRDEKLGLELTIAGETKLVISALSLIDAELLEEKVRAPVRQSEK